MSQKDYSTTYIGVYEKSHDKKYEVKFMNYSQKEIDLCKIVLKFFRKNSMIKNEIFFEKKAFSW